MDKQQPNIFKYVMFIRTRNREQTDGVYLPVLFPRHIMHCDMNEAMVGYGISNGFQENRYHQQVTAVSAGFVDLNTMMCYGESESLELKSRAEDSQIIAEYMKTDGKCPQPDKQEGE